MKITKIVAALALFGASSLAMAQYVPPLNAGDTDPGPAGGVGVAPESNIIITFNADGSIMTSFSQAATNYDGSDDATYALINHTGGLITSIHLASALTTNGGLFAFDGDGAGSATYQWGALGFLSPGPTGYEGPGVTLIADPGLLSGTVDFTGLPGGGVAANGGTAIWSLEQAASLDLIVTPTPEPASMLLFGIGLAGMGFARKNGKKA